MGHSKVRQIVDALNKSSYSQPLNGTQQSPTYPSGAQYMKPFSTIKWDTAKFADSWRAQ